MHLELESESNKITLAQGDIAICRSQRDILYNWFTDESL